VTILRSNVGREMIRVLAAVRSCPDRGAVLPVSDQPECGCAELTECRAGRGYEPGKVTLTNCVECRQGIEPEAKPRGSLADAIALQRKR
jgi:hypothetical protein